MTRLIRRREAFGVVGGVVASVFTPWSDLVHAAQSSGGFFLGINLAGLEFTPRKIPGRLGSDYNPPAAMDIQYFRSKGIRHIRLPIKWERMQPALGGPLSSSYAGLVDHVVGMSGRLGMKVTLDLHNSGYYTSKVLGSPDVPIDAFVDFWGRIAARYTGNEAVYGFDIMNEPTGITDPATWPAACQAVVSTIQSVDMRKWIIVEGQGYSSAGHWRKFNENLVLQDPGQTVIYSAHCYFDRDNSGSHVHWNEELKAGVDTNIGPTRLAPFFQWLHDHQLRGQIGEMGAGQDDQGWLDALMNALVFCKNNGVPVYYWAGGSAWPHGYAYQAEPTGGVEAPQMSILDKFL